MSVSKLLVMAQSAHAEPLSQTRFANPQSISDLHQSALVLLANYHYSNKGQLPFSIVENSDNLQALADIAQLNLDQVLFL